MSNGYYYDEYDNEDVCAECWMPLNGRHVCKSCGYDHSYDAYTWELLERGIDEDWIDINRLEDLLP